LISDDVHRAAAIRDDRDMKPGTYAPHHPKSPFSVILSAVLDRDGSFPIEVRCAFE
jgi:hypothetical protein